jgi:hypothetical protein
MKYVLEKRPLKRPRCDINLNCEEIGLEGMDWIHTL